MSDTVTYPPPAGTTELRRRGVDGPETPLRIHVCTMCNDRLRGSGGLQAGRYLLADLTAAAAHDAAIDVAGIECMSVCKAKITVSFTAPGKWSHVFAIPSNTDPEAILEGARLYARSRNGLFPWSRCDALREGVVARVPPSSIVD